MAVFGLFGSLLSFLATVSGFLAMIRAGRRLSSWASRKWESRREKLLSGFDPDFRERLAYVWYYWRARLRWPTRLMGLLALGYAAWRHPWPAYAIFVAAAAAGFTWITPQMPWSDTIQQPVAAALAFGAVSLCYQLPGLTASLLGLALWAGLGYVSWQICAGVTAAGCAAYFFPTLSFWLLLFAVWVIVLLLIPKVCLPLTELALGCHFWPFGWLYLHAVLLAVLVGLGSRPLVPYLAVFCILLWFFPKTVLVLLAIFVLWMIYPLLAALKTYLVKLVDQPYGAGEPLPKVKDSQQAAEVAISGKTHYDVLHASRAATPAEIKACYKRMALLLHPDKNPHESAAAAFKRVSDAASALSTPLGRAEYDAGLDGHVWDDEGGEAAADGSAAKKETEEEVVMNTPPDLSHAPPGLRKFRNRPKPSDPRPRKAR